MSMAFLALDIQSRLGNFDLDFTCRSDARFIALFGPSGAGKTSLAQMIAGLLTPQSGRISLGSTVLFDHGLGINLPPQHRQIGYVFQDGRLFPHLTVKHNLLFGRRWRKTDTNAFPFDEIVALLDLGALLQRHPASLSGGERQRVAIGRALLSAPRLLLLDEPLSALDAARRQDIITYLARLRQADLVPMITISHRREEVLVLAEEVIMVQDGRCAGSLDTKSFAERTKSMDSPSGA